MSYGYLHLAKVVSYDDVKKGYYLESVALARTSKWGPTPSLVPGLVTGDRVILGATGTSRDNLVVLGKIGAGFPVIGDIPGLSAALAALVASDAALAAEDEELADMIATLAENTTDALDALDLRLDTAESTLVTHGSTLVTHTGQIAAGSAALAAHAATLGLHGGILPVANLAARAALSGNYEGRPIYRQDKDWIEIHDGSVWRTFTHVCTDPLDITDPRDGQTVYQTGSNVIYRFDSTAGTWIPLWIKGNHIKRLGTNTSVATTFQNVPFAAVAEAGFGGITTSDDITFTLVLPGTWRVDAMLSTASGAAIVGSLHEGPNTDPFAVGNTEIYALDSGGNAGGIGAVHLSAEVRVPTASARSVRCSAFAASTTLRSGLGRPRITFNWSPL